MIQTVANDSGGDPASRVFEVEDELFDFAKATRMSFSEPRSTAACRSASIARSSSASSAFASDRGSWPWRPGPAADSTAWRRLGVIEVVAMRPMIRILGRLLRARRAALWGFERAEDGFESVDGVAALALAEPFRRAIDHDMLGKTRWPARWPSP